MVHWAFSLLLVCNVDAVFARFRKHVHTGKGNPIKVNANSGFEKSVVDFMINTDFYKEWPTVIALMAQVEKDPSNQAYLQQWLTDPKAEYMEVMTK